MCDLQEILTRLGKPPVMVPGMTPCTANESFCAAVINAGYHVELAGGGQHSESQLRTRIDALKKLIPAGEEIYLNLLFLNPRLWGFQYPAALAMRKEGTPIGGVIVAAGVPSSDVADDICNNIKESGIRYVGFKPGSAEMIRRVVSIAKRHPDLPIVLQWTGGRGGGHHSFEDFHEPLLKTYGDFYPTSLTSKVSFDHKEISRSLLAVDLAIVLLLSRT